MRFLLDNMTYDHLVDSPERQRSAVSLINAGAIELLMTHVQVTEIHDNPSIAVDPANGSAVNVRDLVFAIPYTITPTYGMSPGVSLRGLARYGEQALLDAIDSEGRGHTKDALLVATAYHEEAILVTADKRMRNRAAAVAVEVWLPERFVAFVDELSAIE